MWTVTIVTRESGRREVYTLSELDRATAMMLYRVNGGDATTVVVEMRGPDGQKLTHYGWAGREEYALS